MWREGRVGPGCEFRVFFDGTRANFGTIDQGAPPQARMPPPPSLGVLIRYKKLEKVTDVRYGPPLWH